MTVNEIFERAIALVDGITDAGIVDTANTADYKARTPFLVNLFQMELIKSGDLFTKYPIAYKPFKNILSGGDHFSVSEHFDTDVTIESEDVARIYYFESDTSSGTVKIEDYNGSWNTLATVNLNNTGFGFVPYKALITPTTGATKSRIVFSGNYYYRYQNVALHSEALSSISRFFDYGTRVRITMPTDCHSIKDVIFKSYKGNYSVSPEYEVERKGNRTEILFNREFEGEVLITYVPNPEEITSMTDDITIDEFSGNIISYMLAEAFMNVEQNDYLAGLFKNKYQLLIAESQIKKPKPVVRIINKYGSV